MAAPPHPSPEFKYWKVKRIARDCSKNKNKNIFCQSMFMSNCILFVPLTFFEDAKTLGYFYLSFFLSFFLSFILFFLFFQEPLWLVLCSAPTALYKTRFGLFGRVVSIGHSKALFCSFLHTGICSDSNPPEYMHSLWFLFFSEKRAPAMWRVLPSLSAALIHSYMDYQLRLLLVARAGTNLSQSL